MKTILKITAAVTFSQLFQTTEAATDPVNVSGGRALASLALRAVDWVPGNDQGRHPWFPIRSLEIGSPADWGHFISAKLFDLFGNCPKNSFQYLLWSYFHISSCIWSDNYPPLTGSDQLFDSAINCLTEGDILPTVVCFLNSLFNPVPSVDEFLDILSLIIETFQVDDYNQSSDELTSDPDTFWERVTDGLSLEDSQTLLLDFLIKLLPAPIPPLNQYPELQELSTPETTEISLFAFGQLEGVDWVPRNLETTSSLRTVIPVLGKERAGNAAIALDTMRSVALPGDIHPLPQYLINFLNFWLSMYDSSADRTRNNPHVDAFLNLLDNSRIAAGLIPFLKDIIDGVEVDWSVYNLRVVLITPEICKIPDLKTKQWQQAYDIANIIINPFDQTRMLRHVLGPVREN